LQACSCWSTAYGLYCVHWKAGVIAAGIFIVLMCILGARADADTDKTAGG
jgi:hypothetical protein